MNYKLICTSNLCKLVRRASPFLVLSFVIFLSSCVSYKDSILIREKQLTNAVDSLGRVKTILSDYVIQPKDILAINVSSFKPELISFFNDKTGLFPVKENGFIYMPILDSVQVAGKTMEQVRKYISDAIRVYALDAFVSITLANFNITILGEVKTPGMKYITNERVTILEAIGLAGDIADFGDRKKIKIVRKVGGDVTIALVDITNEDIILSPYFNLKPGDVIYVQPLKEKIFTFNARQLAIGLSLVGVAYLAFFIINLVKK